MFRTTLVAGLLLFGGGQARPADPLPQFQTLFYTSDGLRLEGPVAPVKPLVLPLGYAVLVPERRGHGKSEGRTFTEDIGSDRGAKFVARLEAETRDVLAAVDYVTGVPGLRVDKKRMSMVGWSFGGMITTLALDRDKRFAAGAVQAPAAANWIGKPIVQAALLDAARRIRTPLQCAVAENDTQTESTRAICEAVRGSGTPAELKIYPPFTPAAGTAAASRPPGPNAPASGHALFGPAGIPIWGDDFVAFLRKHVPGK